MIERVEAPRGMKLPALALALAFAWPRLAAADVSPAKKAERLYDEGVALVDQGNYAAACPKFEESQRLDPALGTQFNLADCLEHTGKLGSAFRLFGAVERAARAAGKPKLEGR